MAVRKSRQPKTRMRSARAPKTGPKYIATYATASRIAELAVRLLTTGRHLSYADIRRFLRVKRGKSPAAPPSQRTIDRYVKALEAVFLAGGFGSIERRAYEDGRKYLFFTPSDRSGAPIGESLEILLSVNLLRSLEGSVLRENAIQLLGKLAKGPDAERLGLQHLTKKFYVVPFGVKGYEDQRHLVDGLVKALLRQERVVVRYRGLRDVGDARVHTFEPYTLAIYKGGIYVIGYSFEKEQRVFLALERIESIEPKRTAAGEIEIFPYPEEYTPEKHTQGAFGIFDTGKSFDVELEILSPETLAYLAPRRFHRTQKLERHGDRATLTMKVKGLAELAPWVMSMAPWVRVVRPKELETEVRSMLAGGLALYKASTP